MKPKELQYTVQIPCRGYIAEYYTNIYGQLKVSTSSLIGVMVGMALEQKVYETKNIGKNFIYRSMTTMLVLELNEWQHDRLGYGVSEARILQINQLLEAWFDLALYQYCETRVKPDGRYRGRYKAILEFCTEFGIDDDKHLETLKKSDYRFRKRKDKMMQRIYS